MNTSQTRTQYRDSNNGQFTTKREADRRPRETERERIKVPVQSKKRT